LIENDVMSNGPLRKSLRNPRYFEDGKGCLVVLSGSHTWANMQDLMVDGVPEFDFSGFLHMLKQHGHNFTRMWQFGHFHMCAWTYDEVCIEPQPYERIGEEIALDGRPQFDLDRWNEAYFARLRDRVIRLGEIGVYVSIMFYDGWCQKHSVPLADCWKGHPFHPANNLNGIDGGNADNSRARLNNLNNFSVLERQKAFIRKCIDTVNDLDNVLYEMINETDETDEAFQWQFHMIEYVKQYEVLKPKRHPVGMTANIGTMFNPILFDSGADWISPGLGPEREYECNPPEADGCKVIIVDTDHLWGHGGNYAWLWKTFMRGMQPIFMDPWGPLPGMPLTDNYDVGDLNRRDYPDWQPIRENMGHILAFTKRLDMSRMVPHKSLTSTGYCLAELGKEYLVFLPADLRQVWIDLRAVTGKCNCEWFDPLHGTTMQGKTVMGGSIIRQDNPFTEAAVLYLKASS